MRHFNSNKANNNNNNTTNINQIAGAVSSSLGGGSGGGNGDEEGGAGINNLSFNHSGSLVAVATKQCSAKIVDPRLGQVRRSTPTS